MYEEGGSLLIENSNIYIDNLKINGLKNVNEELKILWWSKHY